MELSVRREPDGSLRVCKVLAFGCGDAERNRYVEVPYMSVDEVIQFLQHLNPDRFRAVRSHNSRGPLHWNIAVPCSLRKKGLTTVFKLQPNEDFATWQVFALPSVFPQEIQTQRKAIGFGSIVTS